MDGGAEKITAASAENGGAAGEHQRDYSNKLGKSRERRKRNRDRKDMEVRRSQSDTEIQLQIERMTELIIQLGSVAYRSYAAL